MPVIWPGLRLQWSRLAGRDHSAVRGRDSHTHSAVATLMFLGTLARYLPGTQTGRLLRPLRTAALRQGHRPQRWATLFRPDSAYFVYWTRCHCCRAEGRLTLRTEATRPQRTATATGALFMGACPGPPHRAGPPHRG